MATSLRAACAAASRTLSSGGIMSERHLNRSFAAALHRPPISLKTWGSVAENNSAASVRMPAQARLVMCFRNTQHISAVLNSTVQLRGITTRMPPTSIAASSLGRGGGARGTVRGTFSLPRSAARATPRFDSRRGLAQYHFRQYQVHSALCLRACDAVFGADTQHKNTPPGVGRRRAFSQQVHPPHPPPPLRVGCCSHDLRNRCDRAR
eukprot:3332683-Rhodomonas_salina.4